jgi:hypothetical protein
VTGRAAAVLLCFLALACETPKEPVIPAATATRPEDIPKYTTEPEPDYDTDNLLNLTYGAAVVSRTAELTLESSAIHAIDGSVITAWSSPPASPGQTLVFSLLAPARITRVGVTTPESDGSSPTSVLFEVSSDGSRWRQVKKAPSKGGKEPQFWDIDPTEAQYVRVSTTGTDTILIRSVHAIGAELRPPVAQSLNGCWRINEVPARFVQNGAAITGIIATDPPTLLDGGTDGRVAQFMWTQGPMWGYAAIATTPDAAKLSGLKIHEEISTQQYGDGWFGESIPCAGLALEAPPTGTLKPRTPDDRWTMYGLAFDGADRVVVKRSGAALDALARRVAAEPSQHFRVVAHELRGGVADENRQHTGARIASLRAALQLRGVDVSRIDFVSAGGDWGEPPIYTSLQRLMASRVDLERFRR